MQLLKIAIKAQKFEDLIEYILSLLYVFYSRYKYSYSGPDT
jgi:hypothetical protein